MTRTATRKTSAHYVKLVSARFQLLMVSYSGFLYITAVVSYLGFLFPNSKLPRGPHSSTPRSTASICERVRLWDASSAPSATPSA